MAAAGAARAAAPLLEVSIFTERDDLNAAIEHVKTIDVMDRENLFLLGESQGGCVVGITEPRHRDDVRAMVQYDPAFCNPDDARKQFRGSTGLVCSVLPRNFLDYLHRLGHEATHLLSRVFLHFPNDVGVGVQREPCAVVAQDAEDRLGIHLRRRPVVNSR